MNFRNIQERPGTQGLFTDQASFLGTVVNSAYREEMVYRFNDHPLQDERIQELKDEIAELKRDRDGQKTRIQDLEQEVEDLQGEKNDREVDDEI